jgi:hypothetical protein
MAQRVLVKLGLDCPHSSSLYYFLREFDKEGQGWVKLPMQLIQDFFNIKRRALINRLKKGIQNAFYYSYEISKGYLYVKYVSIKVLKEAVYTNNFASVKLTVLDLIDVNKYKEHLYGAAINRQQQACEQAINRKETSSKRILNPYKYIDSDYAHGCDYKYKDRLFVKAHINTIGASQIRLAEYLDKSRSTLIKWCNKFSSLKIWKKKKCISDNPSPDIYEILKTRKNGTKYKVQYKRMPNYYFVNNNVYKEAKLLHKTIYSPALLFESANNKAIQNELNIKAAMNGRNYAGKTYTDKLLFWFKKDQLVDLTINFWFYLKNQKVSVNHFNSFSSFEIANALDLTIPFLEAHQLDIFLMMVNRLRTNKPCRPGYLDY